MTIKNLIRIISVFFFLIIFGIIGLYYWLSSNELKIAKFDFGPLKFESLEINTSRNLRIKRLDFNLTNLSLDLKNISVNWKSSWILLGRIKSLECQEVIYQTNFNKSQNPTENNSQKSFLGNAIIRSLNISKISISSLRSNSNDLRAKRIEGSLSGALLQVNGSEFHMKTRDSPIISSPKFKAKFHFLTNRLILEEVHVHHKKFGDLKIIDLNMPLEFVTGASVSCKVLTHKQLKSNIQNLKVAWQSDNSYIASLIIKSKGSLDVNFAKFDAKWNLTELRIKANQFENQFDLEWLNSLFDGQLSPMLSTLPHPLTSEEVYPNFEAGQNVTVFMDGWAHLQNEFNIDNEIDLNFSFEWLTPSSHKAKFGANIIHKKGQKSYKIKSAELSFSEASKEFWSSKFNAGIARSDDAITITSASLDQLNWKNKIIAKNIQSDKIFLDRNQGISAIFTADSLRISNVLSSDQISISVDGPLDQLRPKIQLSMLSIKEFGSANLVVGTGELIDQKIQLKFNISDYSKGKSFSKTASGLLTWSANYSEGYVSIKTGTLRISDYMDFSSQPENAPETSNSRYKWTIVANLALNDDHLKGHADCQLTFDYRFDGPSGFVELKDGSLRLAGHQLSLLQPAKLKLFPKPLSSFENDVLWETKDSAVPSQSLTQQLQSLWESSTHKTTHFIDYGIWIYIVAGVKFRGEALEIKINGKYPQLQFKLTSMDGKSEDELLKSFLGTLNKNSNQEKQELGNEEYKAQANLLVNTLVDSFFGSVFNSLGTQFHTKVGSSSDSAITIRQPLGDKLSVEISQEREGDVETKSQNVQLEFKPGSSLKIENIEKDGHQSETQVGIQKRFRF